MKILIFWEEYYHYHYARVDAIFKLMESEKIEFFPVALRKGKNVFGDPNDQKLIEDKLICLDGDEEKYGLNSKLTAEKFIKLLNKINPDVVAIPGYDNWVVLTSLIWCRKNKSGAILMSDSKKNDFPRSKIKEIIKKLIISLFDSFFVAGAPHVEYIRSLGAPIEKIFVGYDVVDNDYWHSWSIKAKNNKEYWKDKFNLPSSYFLSVSRLVRKKNTAGVIKAYAKYVSMTANPIHLVIVGDGPLKYELQKLTIELNVNHLVNFLGNLSSSELGPIYGLAKVFILASDQSEQWGLVVNEAMAAGLPVIVSKYVGCSEDLVLDNFTGFSFDPYDDHELASLFLKLSQNEIDLESIGKNANSHIKNYSLNYFAENLLKTSVSAYRNARERRSMFWPNPLLFLK